MHRLCASTVQLVHILCTAPPYQTLPFLPAFEEQQLRWVNSLRSGFPPLPDASLLKASLYLKDGVLGHVPASVVADAALVGSRLGTVADVAALPGERSVSEVETPLPGLLLACFARNQVLPMESPQLPDLKIYPGHAQKTITRDIQECRAA